MGKPCHCTSSPLSDISHMESMPTQQPNLAEMLACDDDVDLPLERANIQLRPTFSDCLTIGSEPQAHQPHNATISQQSHQQAA